MSLAAGCPSSTKNGRLACSIASYRLRSENHSMARGCGAIGFGASKRSVSAMFAMVRRSIHWGLFSTGSPVATDLSCASASSTSRTWPTVTRSLPEVWPAQVNVICLGAASKTWIARFSWLREKFFPRAWRMMWERRLTATLRNTRSASIASTSALLQRFTVLPSSSIDPERRKYPGKRSTVPGAWPRSRSNSRNAFTAALIASVPVSTWTLIRDGVLCSDRSGMRHIIPPTTNAGHFSLKAPTVSTKRL